jgi:hypothetical protein
MATLHKNESTLNSTANEYIGSRFSEVRAQLLSDAYTVLPYHRTTLASMFKKGVNLVRQTSKTLVDSEADLVPPMQKVFHAVGICLFGRWRITEDTGYTGCFRGGTDYLIVVRCSTLYSQTDSGVRRGFGFAGKIFPTLDPDELVKTANFVCIDDLGGTLAKRFTDVATTNEPAVGVNLGQLRILFIVINALWVFRMVGAPNSGHRPLWELTEQGLAPGETPKGPRWIQITLEEGIGKSDAIDFREELRVANYKDGKLRFAVSVADGTPSTKKRVWRRIGAIELTEDVCSESGDHRLRFHHAQNRR